MAKRGDVEVDWFVMVAVGILAVMAGFWIGRWSVPIGVLEAEGELSGELPRGEIEPLKGVSTDGILKRQLLSEESGDDGRSRRGRKKSESESVREESGRGSRRRRNHSREKRIPLGWAIGSPVAGNVSLYYEGNRRGALILSDQGRMYAPASGKIIKLYPMGNRMLLRTDSGVELILQVGDHVDELCGAYFRPRVVQNEIVNKGKLLLEYDRERLLKEGVDAGVSISMEASENLQDITITGKDQVKVGEELMWVKDFS